jgi:hypothetical protein
MDLPTRRCTDRSDRPERQFLVRINAHPTAVESAFMPTGPVTARYHAAALVTDGEEPFGPGLNGKTRP